MKIISVLLLLALSAVVSCHEEEGEKEKIPYSVIRLRRRLFPRRRIRNICNLENENPNEEKLVKLVKETDFIFTGTVIGYQNPRRIRNKRQLVRRVKKIRTKKIRVRKRKKTTTTQRPETTTKEEATTWAKEETTTDLPEVGVTEVNNQENNIETEILPEVDTSINYVIDVKRVIKENTTRGGEVVHFGKERVWVHVPPVWNSGVEINSDPVSNVNCVEFHPVLGLRKTAILFANLQPDSDVLMLNSFPVAITLKHLDKVGAAVKDVTYKPRPPIIEEPCETTYCSFGSTCVTESDGRTHCKCPPPCPSLYSPVCGTDGQTYSSECVMRTTACQRQVNVRVHSEGECPLVDPCKEQKCQYGAKCVVSADGKSSLCQCADSCPLLGDHAGSRPVCGSDGLDYRDTCELKKASCVGKNEISIKFQGKCDPCENVQCPEPEVCQLDVDRQPVCRCGETCSLEFTPVCGSDGKTYSNECSLRQQSCRNRKQLRIIYRGKCSSGVNPCLSVKCVHGEECAINKYGIAGCECPSECEPVIRPVCGTDSKTYDNACELKKAACHTKSNIAVDFTGTCGMEGPCTTHTCTHGALCVERSGKPACECPTCSSEFDPVCGSDGISYGNECKLRLEGCQHRREISILYPGLCNGCENKKCELYSVCESDGSGETKCVCPTPCVQNSPVSPVCGSDGNTYKSECELRVTSCHSQQLITIAYKGDCDLCQGVKCKYGARCEAGECVCPADCSNTEPSESVCASNLVTYTNECEMQKASCSQPDGTQPLNIIFFGDCSEKFSVPSLTTTLTPYKTNLIDSNILMNRTGSGLTNKEKEACKDIHCDYEASCELGPDNFPRCSCKFDCNNILGGGKIVCASDLRIYPSLCAMKMEGCQRQEELRLRPLELCEGMQVKPCNGETPLIHPGTKKEYDCGSGTNRQDCPSGSYCHQTPHFAKCCRKDLNSLFQNCEESWYGCCPDGKTAAQGPDDAGCPSLCGCNKLGSYGDSCEPETGQCKCKPGVGGVKCDRCEPGYWGLPKISEGHQGCMLCGCSQFGSVREDCEQMTGRCVCKPDIQGQKCTVCTGVNKVLGPGGCVSEELMSGTEWPFKRSTPHRYTEPEAISSPQYKSTRHLLGPDHRYLYNREDTSLTSASLYQIDSSNAIWNTGRGHNGVGYRPTPATIHITALLGDLCEIAADCGVRHSQCVQGSCLCADGYLETPDRQECLPDHPTAVHKAYDIPSFSGKSYVRLNRLKAYNKLTIEIEFKAYSYNGILVYSQHKPDGTGDFISLAIVNGFVEFKYNLGNGPVVITSLERIELKRFHRVIAKRYHRDGILKLDDYDDVAGQSQGTLKSLDLEEDAFIGYIPTDYKRVYDNIGTTQGLMGCIRKLKIGRHLVELHEGRDPLVAQTHLVEECGENPCSTLPCKNSGTCSAVDSEHFTCTCLQSYTGEACETRINPCLSNPCSFGSTCESQLTEGFLCHCPPGKTGQVCEQFDLETSAADPAEFNGNSYVELPKLEHVARSFTLELWVLTRSPDGVLVYNGQLLNGKGDFISLVLVNGHVVFQFDLGSGAANITSLDRVTVGVWHSIKVSRLDKEGTLQIDGGQLAVGSSGSPLNELNLELPLYVGGVPPLFEMNKDVKVNTGLIGAIQRLTVNGQTWQHMSSTEYATVNVESYHGPPCNNTCHNGGTCLPFLNSYTCKCLPQYAGNSCQLLKSEEGSSKAIRFIEDFYLEFPNKVIKRKKNEYSNHYEILLKTSQKNGLILWLSKGKTTRQDYLAVTIVNGYPRLSYHIGQQQNELHIRSQVQVNDDRWHKIVVHRKKKRGYIQVDGETPVKGVADTTSTHLNSNTRLFIGGAPTLPSGLPTEYYHGFTGCIESVKVDKRMVELERGREVVEYCHDNDV